MLAPRAPFEESENDALPDYGACDHVYVATDGLLHKIGMSSDPDRRWREIASPRRGKRPSLVTFWYRPFDASYIEKLVKRTLKPMRYRQNTTEWFSVPRDVMMATVSDVIQRHGDDMPDYL